jgi:hypothetical protein
VASLLTLRTGTDLSPKGFPLQSVKQAHQHNGGYVRRFDVIDQRVLLDQQNKISAMSQDLWKFDADDEKTGSSRLTTSVFDREQLVNEYYPFTNFRAPSHCTCYPQSEPASQSKDRAPGQSSAQQSACGTRRHPTDAPAQDPKDRLLEALFWRKKHFSNYISLLISSKETNLFLKCR